MSLINQKKKVFGNIGALKTLNSGLPKLKTTSSFPSINNNGDSTLFLIDILKSIGGYELIKKILVEILTYRISSLEENTKNAIKDALKSATNTDSSPSIPDFLKSNSSEPITSKVIDVDFFDIMQTNPNSNLGDLLYRDINSGIYSSDFNTFLFNVIQSDGTQESWNGILNIQFDQYGDENNQLTLKLNQNYDNKTLDEFNNDFVDSLKIFDVEKIVNTLIDTTFGSISFSKSTKQLNKEIQFEKIIENIINSDEDDIIDNCYFIFDNKEISQQEEAAKDRKNGIRKLTCCNDVLGVIPQENLQKLKQELENATDIIQKNSVLNNNLEEMANQSSLNSNNKQDRFNIKTNFFEKLLNELVKNIVKIIFSTHITTLFLINFKIIYGKDKKFENPNDFLFKNKNLITDVVDGVRDAIIKEILKQALKEITKLIAQNEINSQISKNKARITQLLSLVGVPQENLRLIKGLL